MSWTPCLQRNCQAISTSADICMHPSPQGLTAGNRTQHTNVPDLGSKIPVTCERFQSSSYHARELSSIADCWHELSIAGYVLDAVLPQAVRPYGSS